MLDDGGNRNHGLARCRVRHDPLGSADPNISLPRGHEYIGRDIGRVREQVQINPLGAVPVLYQCDVDTCVIGIGRPVEREVHGGQLLRSCFV